MFTGIIAELGSVIDITDIPGGSRLRFDAGSLGAQVPAGGSIAVNGVCLTRVPELHVAELDDAGLLDGEPHDTGRQISADVMGETLQRTALGALRASAPVNLELCLAATQRLDGHIVQGHVDGVGRITRIEEHGSWRTVRVDIPADLAPLMVEKGSIALHGISLTLTAVSDPGEDAWVEVGLIPATLAATTFGAAVLGDAVNVEADVLAKHTQRLLAFANTPEATR